MQQSAQSLKHRVRTAVFPWLAEGLLCDRRGRLGCDCAPTEAELADVFQAGRTLLYRLLFLAFGEARQLLPVLQTAYRAFSLRKICEEIAGRAGSDPAQATRRIEAAYSADDYQLYGRLCRLLAIVAPGDPAMDVPKFPGTLLAAPANDLQPRQVPDRFLALAIDGLTRHCDPAGRLAWVDFRSLEVRQLGELHETLAHGKLVVCMDSPVLEQNGTQPDQVRLVADKAARKSSGSYYTPQEIVDFIVAHTIGPVLDRKLKQLRVIEKGEPEASAAGRNGEKGEKGLEGEKAADLLDQLLDFRVLDPAMGSGYFLLAAADFITRRLADPLGRFCNIDRQQLKRHVLERCLYGVDLDPLAVELAKASLWLDAAVPGEPPAELDEHLRSGDSLLGFPWEAAFPDAYRTHGDAGFDVVLGNPPYQGVRTGTLERTTADYIATHYRSARGNWDLAAVFLEKGLALGKAESACGFIVPSRIGSNRDFRALREMIFAAGGPEMVIDCGPAFDDPAVLASIVIVRRPPVTATVCLGRRRKGEKDKKSKNGEKSEKSKKGRDVRLLGQRPGGQGWETWRLPRAVLQSLPDQPLSSTLRPRQAPIFQRLQDAPCRLGEIAAITRGMECGKNDPHISRRQQDSYLPVITGAAIRDFRIEPQGMFFPPGLPATAKYKRRELFQTVPKLLLRFVAPYPVAAVDSLGYVNCNTVYNVVLHDPAPDAYAALACLLNSRVVRWWFSKAFNSEEGLFPHIQKYQLEQIPLPALDTSNPAIGELSRLGHAAAGRDIDLSRMEAICREAFGLARPCFERQLGVI